MCLLGHKALSDTIRYQVYFKCIKIGGSVKEAIKTVVVNTLKYFKYLLYNLCTCHFGVNDQITCKVTRQLCLRPAGSHFSLVILLKSSTTIIF